MEYPKFKVCCRCFTFNQAKYITDAMNGFTMQQTSFPFICTIVDDASTDGEQEVIKKYVEENFDFSEGSAAYHKETEYAFITYAQHKTNKNCYFAVLCLKENHYSKRKDNMGYLSEWRDMCESEALCEGDDYWVDGNKLQKQVTFMDCNTAYSMCFHRAIVMNYIGTKCGLKCFDINDRDYSPTELFKDWIVPTASLLYRASVNLYKIIDKEDILNGDIFLVEKCAHSGKVFGMSDYMSVYRIQIDGVTYNPNIQNMRNMKYPNHFECIKKNFPLIDVGTVDKFISAAYINRALIQCNRKDAIYDLVKSWRFSYQTTIKKLLRIVVVKMKKLLHL